MLGGAIVPASAQCPWCDYQFALCLGTPESTIWSKCWQLEHGCYLEGGLCDPTFALDNSNTAPDGSVRAEYAENVAESRHSVGVTVDCHNYVISRIGSSAFPPGEPLLDLVI
jgi:hypothetical protein